MPLLDDAKTCYVGTTPITTIMAGSVQVWPKGPDINADIQFLAHFDKESDHGPGGKIALLGSWTDDAIASFVPERLDNDGKFGKCTTFAPGDSRVQVSFNPELSLNKSLTVDFWLSLNSTTVNYDAICGAYVAENPLWYSLRCFSSTLNLFFVKNNFVTQQLDVGSVTSGWNHIAMTIDNSGTELIAMAFVNGVTNGLSVDESEAGCAFSLIELGAVPQITTGYKIDELRVSEGLRYTGNFTPPTEPYYPDDT